tara:strand:+ start:999 stop:1784 length:786 start_codon:yes stop_codon:yes gene_type:complete
MKKEHGEDTSTVVTPRTESAACQTAVMCDAITQTEPADSPPPKFLVKKAFSDSHKFKKIETDGFPSIPMWIHHQKFPGKENGIYPGVSWKDVVLQNVPLDITCESQFRCDCLKYINDTSEQTVQKGLMVNERNIQGGIQISENTPGSIKGTGESKNFSGLGKSTQDTMHRKYLVKEYRQEATRKSLDKDKTYYRKKKIPTSRVKNYPTKPKKKEEYEYDAKGEKADYFNWEINHSIVENAYTEMCDNSSDQIELSDDWEFE